MICTEMDGWGGDHITKHGTHISRDMGPRHIKLLADSYISWLVTKP